MNGGHGPSAWIGRAVLSAMGWKSEGGVPDAPKFVLIAAPHTSNWDLVIALAIAKDLGISFKWVGKHTLFEGPFGWFMTWIGGVGVDRRSRHDAVKTLAGEFAKHDRLILMIPPEGTRGKAKHWKSGFYWIAKTAGVPICLGFLDYGRRRGGLGPLMEPSGDLTKDLATLRAFYADKRGKYADQFSDVCFKEEEQRAPG